MCGTFHIASSPCALRVGFKVHKHAVHIDAVQLVKHAYGLRTQGLKRARGAVLVYLYAAPARWANGKPVDLPCCGVFELREG